MEKERNAERDRDGRHSKSSGIVTTGRDTDPFQHVNAGDPHTVEDEEKSKTEA